MLLLISMGVLMAMFGYFTIRLKLHAYLQKRFTYDNYSLFYKWENRVVMGVLSLLAVAFSWNFIQMTPPPLSKWVSVLVLLLVGLACAACHYWRIVKQFWYAVKEPFRKIDKRDLRWRIRSHFQHIRRIAEHQHPSTWAFLQFFSRQYAKVAAWKR
ncbi:hypothetical protein D3C81_304880 [compost metagenome]